MADDVHFPPPPKKGGAYREAMPVPPAPAVKRKIVTRAEPPRDPPVEIAKVPRAPTFWERHAAFARHPRPIGAVLALAGGALTWSSVDTLLHGGTYFRKAAMLGPVGLCVGAWSLLFGCPLDAEGHPPPWWIAGYVASAILGFGAGAVLLRLLS